MQNPFQVEASQFFLCNMSCFMQLNDYSATKKKLEILRLPLLSSLFSEVNVRVFIEVISEKWSECNIHGVILQTMFKEA